MGENDEYHENFTRMSLTLYELVNRTVETTSSLTCFFQDQMNALFQSPNILEFPTIMNAVISFCMECNLENNLEDLSKLKICFQPSLSDIAETNKVALKTFGRQECAKLLYTGQGDNILLQHYGIYFTTLQTMLGVGQIEIVPLIRKMTTYSLEQKQRNKELSKEVTALRNEQKAWAKEKSQIQKIQKNEKTLNQRYEATKTECNQLKNQQKTWNKRESELNDELAKLRQTVESLNSKIQDRDAQHSRDVQSLHDVKRNHSKELADRQSAMQKLKEQLEERNAAIKKLEQQCGQVPPFTRYKEVRWI